MKHADLIPDPVPIDGKTMDELRDEINALFEQGAHVCDMRLMAGTLREPLMMARFDESDDEWYAEPVLKIPAGSRLWSVIVV